VEDHCRALDLLIEKGRIGETYNVGGGYELANIELTERILDLVGKPKSLIQKVKDRPGHDRRYSLDTTRLRQVGWAPKVAFEEGLASTVEWYRNNDAWWKQIKSGSEEYKKFYKQHYEGRSDSRQ
jgi:dTDP-glucose 4,6-dehydratase